VYFTLDAPFVRILGLYSNCLEDPGVISRQGNKYPELSDAQLVFLKTALARAKSEHLRRRAHNPLYIIRRMWRRSRANLSPAVMA
jgi:hypothetical protein